MSQSKANLSRELRDWLKGEGITHEIVRNKKHMVLNLHKNSQTIRLVMPQTGSDKRGEKNAMAFIRKSFTAREAS